MAKTNACRGKSKAKTASIGQRKQISFVTVYKQMEVIYTNGIRRINPIYIRPIDRTLFAKTKTVFAETSKFRIDVMRKSDITREYKPVVRRSKGETKVEIVEKGLKLNQVLDTLLGLNRKTINYVKMERALKRVLTEPLGKGHVSVSALKKNEIKSGSLKGHKSQECNSLLKRPKNLKNVKDHRSNKKLACNA